LKKKRRKKQKIGIKIVNPEALEQASINKSKALVEIFWDKLMSNSDNRKQKHTENKN
jgi:hypothetical protein